MEKYVNFKKNIEFSKAINALIPGGAHTYSKGDDQFPEIAPKGIKRGKGVFVWDMDDNKYLDWTMGLTSVCLGHAYKPVIDAVKAQLELGANFQRPAYTDREKVAVCAEQPFFSYDDWFIGTTKCNLGIPKNTKDLTVKFNYNNIESVRKMFSENKGEIACIILEAVKFEEPKNNFLLELQEECKKNGAVFILDEMITGFRYGIGGAGKHFGLTPDLATFGKAVGNGFSVAFLAGKRDIMKLGGIEKGEKKVFLISTTHGAETHALAAAIKVIKELRDNNVFEKNWKKGRYIVENINKVIKYYLLEDYIEIIGSPILPAVVFRDHNRNVSMEYRTLFLQEMIQRGILFQGLFTIAYEHTYKDIDLTIKIFKESLEVFKKAIEEKSTKNFLVGEATKPVFREIN